MCVCVCVAEKMRFGVGGTCERSEESETVVRVGGDGLIFFDF